MNKVQKLLWLMILVGIPVWAKQALVYADFDISMRRLDFEHIIKRDKTEQLVGISGIDLFNYFKKQYEAIHFCITKSSITLRIPKIIHQIWISEDNQVPEELRAFQESWKRFHPDWEYCLWTKDDILLLELYNLDLIEKAENPAEKADILRYEILYRFGGLYVDMDQECLQPFDVLHYMYDFYIGIQPLDTGLVQLGIGVIGSMPKHPLLKVCIESIAQNYANENLKNILTAKTGPIHMTRIFKEMAGITGTRDIALPAHYFYPLGSTEMVLTPDIWCNRGSLAVHHWAKTWNKPQYRRPQFRNIKSWGNLL